MTERYPDDATLLALAEDTATGVEDIPTGRTPYYLEFRKLVQRLLLATQRANDGRVYQDGDLTIGIRPGRCFINHTPLSFAGAQAIAITTNETTYLWLDSAAAVQSGATGFPADRTTFIPLAAVTADGNAITDITDHRGESFLHAADLASLGLAATRNEIDQALAGINASVDAAALNTLTAGPLNSADTEHRHLQVAQDDDSEVLFTLINDNTGGSANVGLAFLLPGVLADGTVLAPDRNHGFLRQSYDGATYHLVGAVHAQFTHEGALTTSLTDKLIGVVPIEGAVSNVILSIGTNMVSSLGADGVAATAKVNGVILATTNPTITSADGAGFRSTAQGDGTAAAVKTDGTQNVARGDLLTVDLTRTAAGAITTEAADIVILIVIRPNRPE